MTLFEKIAELSIFGLKRAFLDLNGHNVTFQANPKMSLPSH